LSVVAQSVTAAGNGGGRRCGVPCGGDAPLEYGNAEVYFANTHPTDGLERLLERLFGSLKTGDWRPTLNPRALPVARSL
jgi:hypothetical protein